MLQSFKLAIKSIISNKMRSILTMLGMVIGVSAVIILVSVVNGYMDAQIAEFKSQGTNLMNVSIFRMTDTRKVTDDDMYQLFEENKSYFSEMTPSVNVSATVKNGTETLEYTTITGVSEDYLNLIEKKLQAGRFISYADILNRNDVCIIGEYTAKQLYGNIDKVINEKISINGRPFTIVGVLERQDKENFDSGGSDDLIYMPYNRGLDLNNTSQITQYIFKINDIEKSSKAKKIIETCLYNNLKDEDIYAVRSNSELIEALNSMIATMSMMIGGIAGISLLVAGVGVMNIMLVSVTERTREIGIRKALGASPGVILQQFVIEAVVTSSMGGLIGITLGCIVAPMIGNLMSISVTPVVSAIIVAFGVSVAIGIIFGYMPAKRAAKLSPIDALRSE